jgi:hypothetical protein
MSYDIMVGFFDPPHNRIKALSCPDFPKNTLHYVSTQISVWKYDNDIKISTYGLEFLNDLINTQFLDDSMYILGPIQLDSDGNYDIQIGMSGKCKKDQSYDDGMFLELEEELGLKYNTQNVPQHYVYVHQNGYQFRAIYTLNINETRLINPRTRNNPRGDTPIRLTSHKDDKRRPVSCLVYGRLNEILNVLRTNQTQRFYSCNNDNIIGIGLISVARIKEFLIESQRQYEDKPEDLLRRLDFEDFFRHKHDRQKMTNYVGDHKHVLKNKSRKNRERLSSAYFSPLLNTDPSINQMSICRKCLDGNCPFHYECETTAEEEGRCETHLPNWRKFCGKDTLSEYEREKMIRWVGIIAPEFSPAHVKDMTDEELCKEINVRDLAWRRRGGANFVSEDGSVLEDSVSLKPFSILPYEMIGVFRHPTSTGVDAIKYIDLGSLEKHWQFQDESRVARTVPQLHNRDMNYRDLIKRWDQRIQFVNEQFDQKSIPELIEILSHDSETAKKKAVKKLAELSIIVDNRSRIINGIIPLIELFSLGNEDINQYVSIIIATFTNSSQHTRIIAQNGAIRPLVVLLKGDNLVCKRNAAFALSYIAEDKDYIQQIVDEDIIDTLVEIMSDDHNLASVDDNDDILLDTVVIIENLLKDTNINYKVYRELVLSKNTIEPLINLLRYRNVKIKKHVLLAIHSLTIFDNLSNLNIGTLEVSIKPILLFIHNNESPSNNWIAARVLATFAINQTLRERIVLEDGINILRDLFIRDNTIRTKIISTIAIAKIALTYRDKIMDSGIVEPIYELLLHENENAKKYARIALENLGLRV